MITIGPLLLWLDHLVHIPRYRVVGWALTACPVTLVVTMSGSALAVTTGIAAGVVLLGTAAAGFHDLAEASGPPARPGSTTSPMSMQQAGSPMTGFRPFFNPATGEWIEYTAIAEDNHGQLVRFTWRSVPGGVITEHIHPRQEERFTILAGEPHFTLNGEQRIAAAGETIVVPAGVPHSEGNPGPGEIEGIVELARHCSPRSFTKLSPAWWPTARPRPGARPRTRSSSVPPSGTSATKAGSPHRLSGPRTSCSRPYGHWRRSSAYAPTTTAGTAGSEEKPVDNAAPRRGRRMSATREPPAEAHTAGREVKAYR